MRHFSALPLLAILLAACAGQEPEPSADAFQEPAAPSVAVAVDADRGLEVAERWCASCHQVAPDGAPRRPAPSFMEIGQDPRKGHVWLEDFMAEEHLPMPTFRLYPDEQAHVIAYIDRLGRGN
ncbi:cytochrome c [Aquibaculum arenosum]|uniref:Cytochrome c n=1 Tax=Aquibaculum arenosum TaxID=3032591 RepID=A0ABT5YJV3_9PROT|nr:cytochrome c [Fodinicurvata sp. CAU 1616]MDF2095225.1 cytochrome c [Fodinicurvata sp. CAU 1616]